MTTDLACPRVETVMGNRVFPPRNLRGLPENLRKPELGSPSAKDDQYRNLSETCVSLFSFPIISWWRIRVFERHA